MRTSLLITVCLGLSTGCQLSELATPESGACSDAIANNPWPKFEGSKGTSPDFQKKDVGWGEGMIPPDFELQDQFGNPTCLWQMVGNFVILDASALWCEPCQRIASEQACVQEALGDDVVFMTFITQDASSQPANDSHAVDWSNAFGLGDGTQTVVMADGGEVVTSGFSNATLPSLVLLDRELRWILAGQDASADLPIRLELESRLNRSADECLHHEEEG